MHSHLDSMDGDRGGKEHKNHDKQMEIKTKHLQFIVTTKMVEIRKTIIDTNQYKGKKQTKNTFYETKEKKNKKKSSLIVPLVQ